MGRFGLTGADVVIVTQRQPMPRPWRGALVVAALLGVVLTACGIDDAEDLPTPPPTEVTTPEPTASNTHEPTTNSGSQPAPVPPPDMRRKDGEGAKAAAIYFMELYQYIYVTGDVAEWRDVSLEQCGFCRYHRQHVVDLLENGGSAEGGAFEIREVTVAAPDDSYEYFRVAVFGDESSSVEYSSDGDVLLRTSGGPMYYDFALVNQEGMWMIWGVSIEAGEG